MRNYREYDVYQVAMDFVDEVYRVTRRFPPEEHRGLRSQVRRAAVSVPSNVAEGAGRGSPADFARFLRIARGSANEVRCQLEIARRQEFISPTDWRRLDADCDRLLALLHGLLRSLRAQK